MRVLRAGGRRYSDPDVIALLREHREATDPYEVVTAKARTLLTDFGAFEAGNLNPFDRMRALASFAGFAVRPMTGTESARAERDAVLMPTTDSAKRGIILYNPSRPVARTIHSIGHEIVHSFFPSSRYGAQFRSLAAVDSRPGRELELLCDHGAAELTMPHDAFASRAAGFDLSLKSVDAIREPFGTSFEATVYRLAQLAPMPAATALFRWRHSREGERRIQAAANPGLFGASTPVVEEPKYRRQSFHHSSSFPVSWALPWNKSLSQRSAVYEAARRLDFASAVEHVEAGRSGSGFTATVEAIPARFQPESAPADHPDMLVLFLPT